MEKQSSKEWIQCPKCKSGYKDSIEIGDNFTCPNCGNNFVWEGDLKEKSAFSKQVGGSYYKDFKIEPYRFFFENKITHEKAAIIRRILRYDKPGGKGLQDLEKIKYEVDLLIELNNYK